MTLTFNPPAPLCISNFSIPRIWRTHETRRRSRSRQRGNVSSIADRKGKRSDRDLLAAATRFRFARSHILRYFHGGLSRFLLLSLSSTSHSIQQPSRKGSIHAYIGDLTWLTNTRPWITRPALISAPRTRMTNDPTCAGTWRERDSLRECRLRARRKRLEMLSNSPSRCPAIERRLAIEEKMRPWSSTLEFRFFFESRVFSD